jgi:hypothetical protein
MVNNKFVQLHGPFAKDEDLVLLLKSNCPEFQYIESIGIQSTPTHILTIGEYDFEIGKTKILEFDDVQITSIYFKQNEPKSTLVDCILG